MKIIITHACSIVVDGELLKVKRGAHLELGDYDCRLLIKANCAVLDEGQDVELQPTDHVSDLDVDETDDEPEDSTDDLTEDEPETDEKTEDEVEFTVDPMLFEPLPHIGEGLSRIITEELGVTSYPELLDLCNTNPEKLVALRGLTAKRVEELRIHLQNEV